MAWLWKLIAGPFLGGVGAFLKPVFGFLNNYVDKDAQKHIADNTMLTSLGTATLAGASNADNANAQVRMKEGPYSPWVLCTIFGFMVPSGWHYWQVVLDSCRWIPTLGDYWLPTVAAHAVGSWKVAALPEPFATTEQAIITSLFIGATTMFAGLGIIKGLRR